MAAERSRSCFLRPRSLLLAAVTVVLLVNGCSQKGAQPPPQNKAGAPAYYPQPSPQPYPQPGGEQGTEGGGDTIVSEKPPSLEEATLQLDQLERELAALMPSGGAIANPSPPPPPGPPGPRPQVKPPTTAQLSQGDRCSLACRALGSMDRSASRICELAGDDDERCQSARERVSKARTRVERSCSACAS